MSAIQPFEQPSQGVATIDADVAMSRAAQEVQGQIVMAKKFPRDVTGAATRIAEACKRKALAEKACYKYAKGGTQITGPSIRLAEVLAQNWGNIDFGIHELEQRNGESTVMCYAWDLETNARQTKVFQVGHKMKARDNIKTLTDPREIYEHVANQGARRLRACILGIIPGDIQDMAVDACRKTLAGNNTEPIADRIRVMVQAFAEFGVTQEMLELRLQHKIAATDEMDLVNLREVYNSMKDGMSSRTDWFTVGDEKDVDDGPTPPAGQTKPKKKAPKKAEPADEKAEPSHISPAYEFNMKAKAKGILFDLGIQPSDYNVKVLLDDVYASCNFDPGALLDDEQVAAVMETLDAKLADEVNALYPES